MKILFTIVSGFILTLFGVAQPVISDLEPAIGDNFLYTQADNSDYLHGLPGANMFWDYSGLYAQALNDLTYTVIDPSESEGYEAFPSATSVWYGEYLFGDFEEYLNFDSGVMTSVGIIPFSLGDDKYYTDPEVHFLFPLAYEDSGTDTYEGLYVDTFWQTEEVFSGSSSYAVNGYGTVETQYGVFSDVLLVSTIKEETIVDAFENIDGKYFVRSAWYSNLYPVPVLMVTTTYEIEDIGTIFEESSDTLVMVSALATYNGVATEVDEISASKTFNIYPNPATDYITINSEFEGEASLTIFSIDGKMVAQKSVVNHERFDLENLQAGYYIARLVVGDELFAQSSFVIK